MTNETLLETVNANEDRVSGFFDLGDLSQFAIQVSFSGSTLTGTLKLQISLDKTVWSDVPSSVQAVTASGSHIWDVQSAGYRYVRAVWTYTSGTGNMTVTIHVKDSRS